ncbi:MAG: mannose-phosphate guanylyltransferase [Thermoanaerobaculia bacterium]|jgi:mannose-1-phosphate guanylyltransferase|nr:mannose-phosphate guanylyltransferase [Thermoanaerobaculia bacterium]
MNKTPIDSSASDSSRAVASATASTPNPHSPLPTPQRTALILAGGAGTRLRPLSSDDNPKQFLRIFDGVSLLEKTVQRVAPLVSQDSIFISTNDQYAAKCAAFLPGLPKVNILTEPARRNTAPAIALCCFAIEAISGGDPVIAVLASDHYIADEAEFVRVLDRAYEFASRTDYLVTIGIEPDEPNTGFGYLQLGREIEPGIAAVDAFTEKPSHEVAEQFLAAGNYAWNASMFVWRASVFRRALAAAAPEIARVTRENYESMPSISIDYALMEKAPRVAAIRGDFGWSDVGSFEALERAGVPVKELLAKYS